MTVKYLRDQRHTGTVAEIAKLKFPFPSDEHPDYETLINEPKPVISVGEHNGKDLFPDIVVVRRPGQWLTMMAEVETADSITDETAVEQWLPFSKCGDLLLYVPFGCVPETKKLLKKHRIKVKGIRTWRFRPVWGLDVAEA
ncbi:MAG: hypothetical protein C0506_12025 [Anaerolinea sp.]|nr:hypothetical protein [Anaerolinea sp.]